MKKAIVFIILGLSAATALSAQNPSKADSLYNSKNWAGAAALYETYLKENTNQTSFMRFHLGICYAHMGKYQQAIAMYKTEDGYSQHYLISYFLAQAYGYLKQEDSTLRWFQKAADNGFYGYEMASTDSAFPNFQNNSTFKKILMQVEKNAHPCADDSIYHQFDFWVGDWKVYNKTGAQVGTSHIESILGKCVILENWTDYFGNGGKSFNTYNSNTGKWEQIWVDDQGTVTHYVNGDYKPGIMTYVTDNDRQKDGSYLMQRITFYNLGKDKVRQFGESSTDGGKTWTTRYDLTYIRVN